jgi:hypothetical protein
MPRVPRPVLGSLVLLAACDQHSPPILPEPVFDKFGRLEVVCVEGEAGSSVGALPRCADHCAPGEEAVSTVAGQWPVCLPPEDGDDDDDEELPPGVAD